MPHIEFYTGTSTMGIYTYGTAMPWTGLVSHWLHVLVLVRVYSSDQKEEGSVLYEIGNLAVSSWMESCFGISLRGLF